MPQEKPGGMGYFRINIVEGKRYILGAAPAGLSLRLNFVSVSI